MHSAASDTRHSHAIVYRALQTCHLRCRRTAALLCPHQRISFGRRLIVSAATPHVARITPSASAQRRTALTELGTWSDRSALSQTRRYRWPAAALRLCATSRLASPRRAAASEGNSAHRPTLLLHDSTEHALVDVAHPLHLRRMHKRVSKRSTSAREAHDPHSHRRQPGRFHLDALCSEARRQSSLHDTCGIEALPRLCLGFASAASFVKSQSALRVLTRKTSSDAKEEKRSTSARFKKSSQEKRSKSARFKNAKACEKCSTQRTHTHTHTQEILPHRASVPRSSGPPE